MAMAQMTPGSLIAASLAMLLVGGMAASQGLPEVQRSGTVEYRSGGIGHDEAQAMQQDARHWPLALEFAVTEGQHAAYAANVAVQIRDAQAHTALQVTSSGPFLFAKLPPGAYQIDAKLGSQVLHRDVQIQPGHRASAVFQWPQGAGDTDL
jgi:hypothetical protein